MKTRWKLVLILAVLACTAIAIVVYVSDGRDSDSDGNYEVVSLPNMPNGPSAGHVEETLTYTIGGASSSKGYNVKYYIDWGDGTYGESDFVDSGPISISHTWHNPGTYYTNAKAISATGVSSSWITGQQVTISEAVVPYLIANTPGGPSTGEVNQTLSYSISVNTNVAGSPQYRFDWGDGSYFSWSSSSDASHSWSSAGTYTIRAQAKLPSITSEWSTGKVVVIEEQALSRQPYPNCQQMKRYITPDDPAVKAALNQTLGQQPGVFTAFETLRTWVALHVSYMHDIDVHGVDEYWQLPSETLELRTGDCEDFAMLLCSLLRAYGVAADQLYVGVGFDENNNGHAYLVERYYEGIWRVTEPQADAWSGWFIQDWQTEVSFRTFHCFNDQYCFAGPPTLPSGVYEFQLSFLGGSSAIFERYMSSGQTIAASVEWLPRHGQLPDFSIFGWGLDIYDASGNAVLHWFGSDLHRSFSFVVGTSGKYKVQVHIGGGLPVSARLTMNPPDWSRQ